LSASSALGVLILLNADNMSMIEIDENDDLLPHYDFDYSKSEPNRFAPKYNGVVRHFGLEPDLVEEFPTEKSVNDALRDYLRITRGENPEIRPR